MEVVDGVGIEAFRATQEEVCAWGGGEDIKNRSTQLDNDLISIK